MAVVVVSIVTLVITIIVMVVTSAIINSGDARVLAMVVTLRTTWVGTVIRVLGMGN